MFDFNGLWVQLWGLLILFCMYYCSTGVAEEDVERWIVPNQRQSISDCHFRYYKYAQLAAGAYAAHGTITYLGEFAHMAAIGWSLPNGTTKWQCGGSLIWDNYVLTAAHCTADGDNRAPDVARFGDLDLYNDNDDQHAQQRKIVEIIRHPDYKFSRKYHDIALMRLETKVSFHETVAPACLWSDDEVRFKTMEATGWGDTGFGQERSPVLLKVSLSQVDPDKCSQHYLNTRGLRSGLHANQICAGDVKMDTCPGDSGGPLEVKLMHNTQFTPFVVGVTSFGTACGHSVPGIYTRVAPYIPWIRSVLNERGENATEEMFLPQACALRYIKFREYIPQPLITPTLRGGYKPVSIHWDGTGAAKQIECYGVIIDENTIVTLARCTTLKGKPPTYIRYEDDQMNPVMEIFRHPNYKENSLYNDIALLKVKEPFSFSSSFYPACLFEDHTPYVPYVDVSAHALLELMFAYADSNLILSNQTVDVHAVGNTHIGPNCSLPDQYTSRLEKGLTEEHLCFGADRFLVPGTCDQSLGGPIRSRVKHGSLELTYVHALNLFGRDCGYGESAVGVKISHHTKWMQSITQFPTKDEDDPVAPLIFLNAELEEGDRCEPGRGSDGTCVQTQYCPKLIHEFRTEGQVQFCQTGSLVCCPQEYIRNGTDAEWREIDECENLHMRQKSSRNSQSLVSMIWKAQTGPKTCTGTIITSRTIVTAANCVIGTTFPSGVSIEQADSTVLKSITLEKVIVHPEFDSSTKQHNIALIKTKDRLDESLGKAPACLWTNTTHTPFYLTLVSLNKSLRGDTEAFASYSVDCEGTFGRVLQPHELCVDVGGWGSDLFVHLDAPALWNKHGDEGTSIPYLIGIGSQMSSDDIRAFLHTRVSSYVSWIKGEL